MAFKCIQIAEQKFIVLSLICQVIDTLRQPTFSYEIYNMRMKNDDANKREGKGQSVTQYRIMKS